MAERCAGGRECQGWTVVDGKRIPATLDGTQPLCGPCQGAVRAAAKALPGAYHELHALIGEQQTALLAPRVSGTPEPPIPINTAVNTLQTLIVETAERAAELVAEKLNVEMVSRRRGWPLRRGQTLTRACNLIEPHIDTLIATPTAEHTVWVEGAMTVKYLDGAAIATQLIRLHKLARRYLGQTTPAQRQDVPCPHCQQKALVREVRDLRGTRSSSTLGDTTPEVVSCRSCGNEWTQSEWRWLQNLILSEAQQKEVNMLRWLLAEKTYELDLARAKIERIETIANSQVDAIPSVVLVELLHEVLYGKPVTV